MGFRGAAGRAALAELLCGGLCGNPGFRLKRFPARDSFSRVGGRQIRRRRLIRRRGTAAGREVWRDVWQGTGGLQARVFSLPGLSSRY